MRSGTSLRAAVAVVAVVAVVAALSGCTFGPAGSAPTVSRSADAAHSPTPSPAPTSLTVTEDPADPSTWIISAEGIGPVHLGDTVAHAVVAATAYTDVTASAECPNPQATYLASVSTPDAMVLESDAAGTVVGIGLDVAGPMTAEGVGVGSPVSQIAARYPAAIAGTRGPSSVPNLWTVKGVPGWISYEFAPADSAASVMQVSVVTGNTPPYEWCG